MLIVLMVLFAANVACICISCYVEDYANLWLNVMAAILVLVAFISEAI